MTALGTRNSKLHGGHMHGCIFVAGSMIGVGITVLLMHSLLVSGVGAELPAHGSEIASIVVNRAINVSSRQVCLGVAKATGVGLWHWCHIRNCLLGSIKWDWLCWLMLLRHIDLQERAWSSM
jgi:hypothetical protein